MDKELGIKFRRFDKTAVLKGYKEDSLKVGSFVIAETDRGTEFGTVVIINKGSKSKSGIKLRKVIRYADQNDIDTAASLVPKEKDLLFRARRKARELEMPVKIVDAEIPFDESKVMLYYRSTDQKKQFVSKDLVKELSAEFGKRIEMHMVSSRDEAKMISGMGNCGRVACCCSFLDEFPHITVKMLKEQGIPVNQSKVCGLCGKLLCCIKHEYQPRETAGQANVRQ